MHALNGQMEPDHRPTPIGLVTSSLIAFALFSSLQLIILRRLNSTKQKSETAKKNSAQIIQYFTSIAHTGVNSLLASLDSVYCLL